MSLVAKGLGQGQLILRGYGHPLTPIAVVALGLDADIAARKYVATTEAARKYVATTITPRGEA